MAESSVTLPPENGSGNASIPDLHLGSRRAIYRCQDIECADEQEAIQKAQQAVDGHNIELWERGRFITRLAAEPGTKK